MRPIKNFDLDVNEDLKDAIEKSIKDFKATLFIKNLNMSLIEDDYNIKNIELELE